MNITLQTESLSMYAYRKLHEGFTLVELIIVMVILGILAAVAVPKMGNVISKSGEAAAAAVIAQLESAAEIYALDQVLLTGSRAYPSNPFDELEKQPDGYKTGTFTAQEGDWWFNSNVVYHHRNGSTYSWTYITSTGELN
jgi:prepilin-type N-terminal cleavage/methylation domain-containing protein|tara:strand:+ start:635 stop:1054 length:420 start_codon:yes stop_codon:yes gene_type:complete